MKSTPSSTARRSTCFATSGSFGGPQMPGPVMRIAPNPSRCTSRSPPMVRVPLALMGLSLTLVSSSMVKGPTRGNPAHDTLLPVQQGRASETARRVAAQRLTFARLPGEGRAADDEALHRDVADGVTWEPTPMTRYLGARTAFFDRAVVSWTGPQVVALGAGDDGRSLRYDPPRGGGLDHPATFDDKQERLRGAGLPPPPRHRP